jgi:5-methylcytosine-specific restriction endonuclease McrA
MPSGKSKPGKIHLQIIEVMKRFPMGISGGQIREELARGGLGANEQTHLDRRKRDLKKWFEIEKRMDYRDIDGKKRKVMLYVYHGKRKRVVDEGGVNQRIRGQVLRAAHGQCQMCGRTISKHQVTLVVDHKKPREWGGTNDRENLWAICEECNAGKKDYFSSLRADSETMKKVLGLQSVHMRIGELLKATGIDRPTPSDLLEMVADQDDWHKRLRELRYPVIGWEIDVKRRKAQGGRILADYILRKFRAWPADPTGAIRRFEEERERKNKENRD